MAKTAGFSAGPAGDPDQIAPDILELLMLGKQDLEDLASAVADDVRNIKEELQE
jgi:hypothetical protein